MLAPKVSAKLGQPIVVENRPGAGGTVGVAQVGTAKADGYTIVHGTNGTHGVAPVLYSKLPYNPGRDFIGVTRLTSVGFLLMVPSTSPIMNLQQFIADLKAHPDTRTFGSSGSGSIPHIAGEAFAAATATTVRHIPYKAVPAVLNDVLGGRLAFMVDSTTNSYALVKGGRLRALAVLTGEAQAFPPEVPTLASAGIRSFDVSGWDAIFVPAATPRPVIDKLNRAITEALKDPEISKAFLEKGLTPVPTTVEQAAEFMKLDLPRWAEATRRTGAKAD
ncbi:MAG TPA: tripartite tricarboxylate transporter substrate binding protein [Ramlibacter sp.]|nr:tripartite tricarboxylate transporter substrate binding protein [Ramlibacter sp.]